MVRVEQDPETRVEHDPDRLELFTYFCSLPGTGCLLDAWLVCLALYAVHATHLCDHCLAGPGSGSRLAGLAPGRLGGVWVCWGMLGGVWLGSGCTAATRACLE